MTNDMLKKLTKEQQECHDADMHQWFQVAPDANYYCQGSTWVIVECKRCDLRIYIELDMDDLVKMTLDFYHGSSIEEYVVENNESF